MSLNVTSAGFHHMAEHCLGTKYLQKITHSSEILWYAHHLLMLSYEHKLGGLYGLIHLITSIPFLLRKRYKRCQATSGHMVFFWSRMQRSKTVMRKTLSLKTVHYLVYLRFFFATMSTKWSYFLAILFSRHFSPEYLIMPPCHNYIFKNLTGVEENAFVVFSD